MIEHEGGKVTRIAGDPTDPFSHGHLCPKGVALQDLYEDPDRLKAPLRRTADGWQEISWEDALDEVAQRFSAIRASHGKDALGVYAGNPNVHHYANLLGLALLLPMLDTRARFSAVSVDNLPHMFAAAHMFGHPLLIGVPDVDRTDHLLILGANPWASNGGGMSSGDVRARVRAVQTRGGKVIVVDPRRTETAAEADAWHAIRPGGDALLLLAMLQVVFDERLVRPGPWQAWTDGLDALQQAAATYTPESVADATGLSADTIRALARDFAAAPAAVLYARIGVCTQEFGGLASWLVYALHVVTGNLDRPGGLMFARPAVDLLTILSAAGVGAAYKPGATRGTGLPGFADELPLAALAEEIETPGPGQIRALLCVAGNPARSAPNGRHVEAALDKLDYLVCIGTHVDETAARAHLILPATSALQRDHYPLGLSTITVRSVASWSDALFPADGGRDDWDILTDLAQRIATRERRYAWSVAIRAARRTGPQRVLDGLLRAGPFGVLRGGLTLDRLRASTTSVDLGPLVPCLPGRLKTPDRRVHLAPEVLLADLPRLAAARPHDGIVLIGRRDLRSNNSWMHNSPRLMRGRPRCTLHVHPDDAARHGLSAGDVVEITSRTGTVRAPVEVTDTVRPGVVSLPHGWGHHQPGARMRVAASAPGVSANVLTDDARVDRLTGTAVFSAVPVTLTRVDAA